MTEPHTSLAVADSGAPTAIDPVCGMTVKRDGARGGQHEHAGTTYYFCNPKCRERFAAEPEKYLQARAATPVMVALAPAMRAPAPSVATGKTGQIFVCPMDPEVRSDKPGPCPKCGMALEPEQVTLDQDNPELRDMSRRLWLAAAFTGPLLALTMGDMLPGHPISQLIPHEVRGPLELVLASPVCLWAGWPFLERAVRSVQNRSLNMFTLIGLGVTMAYLFSLCAVLFPSLFPASLHTEHGAVGLYFEASAAIVTLVLVGQVLELRARNQTGAALRKLLQLAPKTARRLTATGQEEDVPLEALRLGDHLRIRPGEKVPSDGVVLDGASHVDEAMVTGEPAPVGKKPGDPLIAGTVNGTGTLTMKVEKVGADTLLARIVALVAEAQRSRAPIQKLVDVVASYFVPAVIAVSLASFALWYWVGPEPRLAHALVASVSVLIIACPCALGLATPMSIMVATGRAASLGVLFRNAEAIELLQRVDTLVVDKTGTLTEGKPSLVSIVVAGELDEGALLGLAASLERASEHPLAAAVLKAAEQRSLTLAAVSGFESLTGKGVRGVVGERRVALGNRALLSELGVDFGARTALAEELRARGDTVIFAIVDGKAAGLFVIADPIKASTPEAIGALHKEGVRVVMLTGDTRATAQAVAQRLGIDEVIADALPEAKADAIRRLQSAGRIVAMAGDGINDAPALALATVGIAMGTGTDIAMESAGVTLVKGDLRGIVRARALSRLTLANIKQNLFFAFAYNAIGIPLAAGALYPTFGVLLSPMLAAAAMSLSSVSVIGNALRLRGQSV